MISRDQVALPHPVARSAAGRRPANVLRVAQNLSIAVAALMAIASVLGLFASGTYHDNDWARSGFRGNDLVSLALAVPLVLGSLVLARRGSVKAHVVWLGTLAYTLYNYLFYLFGAAFNDLFLVYVGLVALSVWALVLGLISTNPGRVRDELAPDRPSRWVAGNMLLIALFLGIAWIAQSLTYVANGKLPQNIVDSGIHTSIVFALDLSFIVPAMVVGAWIYWSRNVWGATLAGILVVKAAAYTIALISMSFFAAESDIDGAWTFIPVWLAMSIVSLISCRLLFCASWKRALNPRVPAGHSVGA